MKRTSIQKYMLWMLIFMQYAPSAASDFMMNSDDQQQGWYVGLDYLIWKPEQDQLLVAWQLNGALNAGFIGLNSINSISQCFTTSVGSRLNVGYSFCSDWDIKSAWTHVNNCSPLHIRDQQSDLFTAPFIGAVDFLAVPEATSDWTLRFNAFDLECARSTCLWPGFNLRSHMGLKLARIKQQQLIKYFAFDADITNAIITIAKCNRFFGAGPRAGFDMQWDMGHCFNIIGAVSGALLFGKFKIQQNYDIPFTPRNLTPTLLDCNKDRIRPTLQMITGVNWAKPVCDIIVEFGVAYEAQYWWNQWQNSPVFALFGTLGNGDLMFHGATISGGVRF
jgi:hypothetical protein